MSQYDVIIIGAGTSGLTARREVIKKTDNYLVIHDGPFGTTCARVGCMPSKVLIQVANDFHQTKKLIAMNLIKADFIEIDRVAVMKHVRSLRDRFVRGVLSSMPDWEDKLIKGRAQFIDKNTVTVKGEKYQAKNFIVATGSRPNIPEPWLKYKKFFIDTDSFFEQEVLPEKLLVVGLGVIGLELGQALSRIGVKVVGVSRSRSVGGLVNPDLQEYAFSKIQNEFPVYPSGVNFVGDTDGDKVSAEIDGEIHQFDKVLMSVGRRPNIDNIGFDTIGVPLDEKGQPKFDVNTMALTEASHIYLPGDINADRPILHEAADEGRIAGFNSVNENECFKRREFLGITFSDPNIASVGESYADLQNRKTDYVVGKVTFEGQGRAIVKFKEQGLLYVYADKKTGLILGAEMQAPDGEHLAHLLSWAMSLKMTVFEALKMPFYHPVVEEGLRTALRDAANQIDKNQSELFRCADSPIR